MSGLSLADMRRIGVQRNAACVEAKPAKKSLFSKLPFAKGDSEDTQLRAKPNPLDRLGVSANSQRSTLTPDLPETPTQVETAQLESLTQQDAEAFLKRSLLTHVGAAGVAGALVGFGATGSPVGLPAGAVMGALAGNVLAKRAQTPAAQTIKSVALKDKHAPELFDCLEDAWSMLRLGGAELKVHVVPNAAFAAHIQPGAKSTSDAHISWHIGLLALAALSPAHVQALALHSLLEGSVRAQKADISVASSAKLSHLHETLAVRPAVLRLARLEAVQTFARQAAQSWQSAHHTRLKEADARAAQIVGPSKLVEALLAQALLAANLLQEEAKGLSFAQSLEGLKAGLARADLDSALRLLAQLQHPSADDVQKGMPVTLIDRFAQLDTSCALPCLPASAPMLQALPAATQKRLIKQFAPEPKKSGKSPVSRTKRPVKDAAAATKKRAARRRPLARLLPGKPAKSRLADTALMETSLQLYEADALYQDDAAIGLEAYQSLVDQQPRWGLARLRLAEAQVESGDASGVANLMACAQTLPSALPMVLDRLQSAMAMVSPLEQETLRQALDGTVEQADQIAQERGEIDLAALADPTMDGPDRDTLLSLFAGLDGLREAWIFGAPCAFMSDVPHHAIIALAPRMAPDDAQALALAIAEHAAILGTVAVHIETGTPTGPLGDALASKPSAWRLAGR